MPTRQQYAAEGETDLGWAIARVRRDRRGRPAWVEVTCRGCGVTARYAYGPVASAFAHDDRCPVFRAIRGEARRCTSGSST